MKATPRSPPIIKKLVRGWQIVEKLIDYVLVGKKDPVTKEVPIEIHWNF